MLRLIQTLALGAALVTLATCIWRDYGFLAATSRVTVAYLATLILGAVLALGGRLLGAAAARSAAPAATVTTKGPARRRRERALTPPPGDAKTSQPEPAADA